MKHRFTSLLSSLQGPRPETIHKLQMLARCYNPSNAEINDETWLQGHAVASGAL